MEAFEEVPTYAVAQIRVRYGHLAQFSGAMERLVPIMADLGWKLNASYQTIIGNFHDVYDIWELPNADAVGLGLAAAAADPRFAGIGPDLAESIESESLSIVVKTPFSS